MQVESAGFTLAPLQGRYMRGQEESPTCLVTFVLKVDLGGWLSDQSWARVLFQPWYKLLANAFLEPLLMSVIALRDTVNPLLMPSTPPQQPPEIAHTRKWLHLDSQSWRACARP